MGAGVTVSNFQEFYVDWVPSCHTSAVTTGNVLADTESITLPPLPNSANRNHVIKITKVILADKDDNGANLDLYFLTANTSMGTEGGAISIAAADTTDIATYVTLDTYKDLINSQLATSGIIDEPILQSDGVLYAAVVCNGSATYSADGLAFRIWFQIQR